MDQPELVKIMTGLRRSRKSVMLELIRQELTKKGMLPENMIVLNFEDMSLDKLYNPKNLHVYLQNNMMQVLRNCVIGLLLLTTVIFAQEDYIEIAYSTNTPASRSSISGTILPGSNGIEVLLYGALIPKKTTANMDGSFSFENLSSGEYIVNISKPGYYDHPVAISLKENESQDTGEHYLQRYPAENDFILESGNAVENIEVAAQSGLDSQYPKISDIKVLTVCEYLKIRAVQPLTYVQLGVIIIGNLVQTPEGSWLQQSCGNSVKSGNHSWPDAIFLDNVDNMSNNIPSERASEVNKNRYDPILKAADNLRGKDFIQNNNSTGIAVAVIGRLITSDRLVYIKCGEGKTCGFGYGAIAAPAQITYWHMRNLNQQYTNDN